MTPRVGGRPQIVDRAQILAAALELGVDNFSMHAVARKLGVSAAALYRYFGSREELLDACIDEFCSRLVLPASSLHWTDYLRALGRNFRTALQLTPGVHSYGIKVGPTTPSAFRIFDEALAVLIEAGIDEKQAWKAYGMIVDHAFHWEQKSEAFRELEKANGPNGYRILQLTEEELEGFPHLAKALASVLPLDVEPAYEEQLDVLVRGLESQIGSGANGE
ncbi:MAG: TetR family transcriptional regulator [Acidobacteriota bacterium]